MNWRPATWNIMWSNARSEAALEAELGLPIAIVPMRRARRMRLRFDEARGQLKLTCPWRTSRKAALSWALEQRDWIDVQLAKSGEPVPLSPDVLIPVEGRERRVDWHPSRPRRPTLEETALLCGGPREGGQPRDAARAGCGARW